MVTHVFDAGQRFQLLVNAIEDLLHASVRLAPSGADTLISNSLSSTFVGMYSCRTM